MIMVDFHEKEPGLNMGDHKKSCTDCKTTKTPLWRGGPDGPKSLCNACGIRYRKRRASMVGLSKGDQERKRDRESSSEGGSSASSSSANPVPTTSTESFGDVVERDVKLKVSLKIKLKPLEEEVLLKSVKEQRRKLGEEEEQAAFCLMAMSCGSVLA